MVKTGTAGCRISTRVIGLCVLMLMAGCGRSAPAEATPTMAGEANAHAAGSSTNVVSDASAPSAPGTVMQAPSQAEAVPAPGTDAKDDAPDPSFTDSKTRPEYDACIKRSGGVTWALQQCGDAELSWQDGRLNRLYKQALAERVTAEKEPLRNAQRDWLKKTDAVCAWDSSTQGQAQMLDAQSCRLNRTANRADELARIIKVGK